LGEGRGVGPGGTRTAAGRGAAGIVLRWLPWVILLAGVLFGLASSATLSGRVAPMSLLVWTGAFFVALLLRLLIAIRSSPGRVAVLTAMLGALILWLGGSYVLSLSEASAPAQFPGPGEWLFLAAGVCLAAFVFLDGQSSTALRSATAWADAVILCGGAAALAAAIVALPVARAEADGGTALLAALIFPIIDVVLALMVIAQWALGARSGSRRTSILVAGFASMALADMSLVLGLPSGTYSFPYLADLLWATAFALLVEGACAPASVKGATTRRSVPRALLMTGFGVALLLLVVRPPGPVGTVIAVSSALVLAAAGVRLLLALKAAQAASDALRRSAVDDLTGLPNRQALLRRIDDVMSAGGRAGLIYLDVDNFQEVNDALGHSTGDYVVRVLAGRISEVVPQGALLARTGGDEFGVLVTTDDPVVLLELAAAMRSRVAQTMGVEGLELTMRMSVGIGVLEQGDVLATDLLRRADVAQFAARESGSGVEVYRAEADPFSRDRLELARDLRDAVRARELVVWYQPTVSASTGAVVSLEALVRWQHPQGGMIPPGRLLPLARREGLMLELSKQVVDRAIADVSAWRCSGLGVSVSINVAPTELLEGLLVAHVIDQARVAGLDPSCITLEVAEDSFRIESDHARRALLEAGAAGLRTSIDDYGSGFSSLSYLRDLPVSEVKLDRTFFAAVVSDPRSAVIVSSTVAMAHALGMSVVAEGVETEYVASRAIVLGVDALQGYYLSPPLPPAEVPRFVAGLAIGG
jgi:diguanylate cyclase (GGDEF)-like protein